MSILLLGARFPQNGSPLSCIIKKDCRVITSYETGTGVMRCDDFTAKELQPHGRLIDADAMIQKAFEMRFDNRISEYALFVLNRAISEMPTVIEGEDK